MNIRYWSSVLAALLCSSLFAAPIGPGEGAKTSYKVLVMGDAHFDAPEFHRIPPTTDARKNERSRNLKMWKAKSPALFAAAGKRAAAEKVAFAVQLGDLSQGDCDDEELQGAMIRKAFDTVKKKFPADVPLLIVKGNHDIRTVKKNKNNAGANAALLPIISRELGTPVKKNTCYSFTRGRDLYIAIDDFISAKAIEAFVKKSLDAHPKTRYVIFMSHLPLLPASVGNPFWVVPGHERIAALLETRNTLILAAHTHSPSLITRTSARGKLTQLIVSSMGHSWGMKHAPGEREWWDAYTDAVKKNLADGKDSERDAKLWAEWESSGSFTYRHLFHNAGFVILDVGDEALTVRCFNTPSRKPGLTLKLLSGR